MKKAKKYEVSSIEHTSNARNGRHVASFGSRRDSRLSRTLIDRVYFTGSCTVGAAKC